MRTDDLIKELRQAYLTHLWRYLWCYLRTLRWKQFLNFLVPQVKFATKKSSPDERWKLTSTQLAKAQVLASFSKIELFDLALTDENGEKWASGELFVENNKEKLDEILLFLNDLFKTAKTTFQFADNEKINKEFSRQELELMLSKNYFNFLSLTFFGDFSATGPNDATNLRKYLRNTLRVSDAEKWFILESNLNETLSEFIWRGDDEGYETVLADYEYRVLYFLNAQMLYLTKHPSLFLNLKDFYFFDFQQLSLVSAELRDADLKRVACPPLVLYYDETATEKARLGRNNHFVKFINDVNLPLQAKDDYKMTIKNAEQIIETAAGKPFLITQLNHLYGFSENTLIVNRFALHLTNFLSPVRFAEISLLINDNVSDSDVEISTDEAFKNADEINNLVLALKDATKKTAERQQINERLKFLREKSAQLTATHALDLSKELREKLDKTLALLAEDYHVLK